MNLRPVIIYDRIQFGKPSEKHETGRGMFHAWGFETLSEGHTVGTDSVAIVELPDGRVETLPPCRIRFSDVDPTPFRAEEFGISATAPGFDPTGEGSAYQPAEPAPGSDAEHPPLGYRLEPVGGVRRDGYIYWQGGWEPGLPDLIGDEVSRGQGPIANPIPAAENDSQACAKCAKLNNFAKRETARADAATGRAVLAERRFADLLAELSQMIEEVRG